MSLSELYERARRIRLVVFDVDGVLTDGSLFITESGEEFKAFHSQDGHGMKMLQATGVRLAIITGRSSRSVELRAQNLGVGILYQGVEDKLAVFEQILTSLGFGKECCAFIGDDVVDLPVMRRCGLAVAVPDAPPLVKSHAHYVTRLPGGRGAVRELCEIIMHAQGTFDAQMESYLR
ncbi:MAG: 3-deoxy-manno-octulosonate-8-phosphatase KdsC [Betaproteobacteria bacterium]|nr:3-deoxy-manno-octulosonate-8-phosphatase KdsC [Betaproteobacteria bacterium]